MSISRTESSSVTEFEGKEIANTYDLTIGVESKFGLSPSVTASAEFSYGYSDTRIESTERTSAQEATEESSRYVSDSQELTETFSSGTISVGVELIHPLDPPANRNGPAEVPSQVQARKVPGAIRRQQGGDLRRPSGDRRG